MEIFESPEEFAKILYKISSFATTQYEKDFVPDSSIKFASDNALLPLVLVTLYMLFCFFGSKVMKSRKEFDLRLTLAAWNAFLSAFSFFGMIRTVPFLLASILSKPYYDSICTHPTASGSKYLWIWKPLPLINYIERFSIFLSIFSSKCFLLFCLHSNRLWLRACRVLGHVIYFQQGSGIDRYSLHCIKKEKVNFPALVSSRDGVTVLLARIFYVGRNWIVLCCHELLSACCDVRILLLAGTTYASPILSHSSHHSCANHSNVCWYWCLYECVVLQVV